MSVNTPKRPKTAYYPGLCGESPVFGHQWPTDMLWSNVDSTASPSTSCCGSPEMPPALMRTPSTTSTGPVDSAAAGREAVQFPTPTTCTSNNASGSNLDVTGSSGGREHKRGRPRSETLTNLMLEGSTSPSAIKCKYCYRVFPREKSLAAHLRTHTGERPYVCDYPGCTKSFTQSGQMKTHQRLHTGERPFICPVPACEMRFTHANRHCPVHVNAVLKRDDKFVVKMTPEQNEEVLQWLEKYRAEREDKSTPTRKTPQRSRSTPRSAGTAPPTPTLLPAHQDGSCSSTKTSCAAEDDTVSSTSSSTSSGLKRHPPNDENECPATPTTPSKNPYKSRKGLMVELDMNAGLAMSPLAPLKMKPQPKVIQWQEPTSQGEEDEDDDEGEEDTENRQRIAPKYYLTEKPPQTHSPKRLKEKENRNYSPSKKGKGGGGGSSTFNPKKKWLREACMEDLAKPLEGAAGVEGSPRKLQIKSMNLLRPTVLMLASKDKLIPLSGEQPPETPPLAPADNRRWLGKMALMQLATEENQLAAESGAVLGVSSTSGPPGDFPEYTQL